MGFFTKKANDTFQLENGVLTINFEKSGELTKKRVEKVLQNDSIHGYKSSVVHIGKDVTSIEDSSLSDCSSITKITISNGVKSIGRSFLGSNSCTRINIPESVTSIDDEAFLGCSLLAAITVEEDNPSYKSIDGNLYTEDGKTLLQYAIGKNDTSFTVPAGVQAIGKYAFQCSNLASIILPHGIEKIGDYAFSSCHKLTSITIPDTVTAIGGRAFAFCKELKSVSLSKGLLTLGAYAFTECLALEKIELPQKLKGIEKYTFNLCESLTSAILHEGLTYIGDGAFNNCKKLSSITIPKGVTTICPAAFLGCAELTSIVIPKGVGEIGKRAFFYCNKLDKVEIPSSTVTIGEQAFSCCGYIDVEIGNNAYASSNGNLYTSDGKTLVHYAINKENTSFTVPNGVTTIGSYAFAGSHHLENIVLPEGLINIGNDAFSGCTNLSKIIIPNGTESIGSTAFTGCIKLVAAVIPKSVTSIGEEAFVPCNRKTIYCEAKRKPLGWHSSWKNDNCPVVWDIRENGITEQGLVWVSGEDSVTIIDYEGKEPQVAIPTKIHGKNVTAIGDYAFASHREITSLTISKNITSIGNGAFYNCSGITSLNIPAGVTVIGEGALSGLSSLKNLSLPFVGGNKSAEKESDEGFFGYIFGTQKYDNSYKVQLSKDKKSYRIPNSLNVVTISGGSILTGCLKGCTSIEHLRLLDNVRVVEEEALKALDINIYCEAPQKPSTWVSCHGFDNSSVTWSVDDFGILDNGLTWICKTNGTITIVNYCGTATELEIPDMINGKTVTAIGTSAFSHCKDLKIVKIPSSINYISSYVFGDEVIPSCISVAESNQHYKSIDGSLYTKDGSILIMYATGKGDTAFKIPDGVKKIEEFAFSDSILITVDIPNTVTSIGDFAFSDCKGLKSITIPSSVAIIGNNAFSGCNSLTTITIDNGVKTIDSEAFEGCSSLKTITIPDSVQLIGSNAFSGCSSLKTITIPDSVQNIDDDTFFGCSALESMTIPFIGSLKSLSKGDYFSNFGRIFGYKKYDGSYTAEQFYNDERTIGYEIPLSLKSITVTDGDIPKGAFSGCSKITSITIPENATRIGDKAFFGCSSLKTITIPDSVQGIGEKAFSGCSALESMTIPFIGSSKSLSTSDYYRNFGEIFGRSKYEGSYTAVQFYDVGEAIGYEIPLSLKSVTVTDGDIPKGAFSRCSKITSITIPENAASIGQEAFEGCSSLKTITIPDSVTNIGFSAFDSCTSLASINIPNSVTYIGLYAFDSCTSLASINIPNSVTYIGESAFRDCTSLTIHCESNERPFGWYKDWNYQGGTVVWGYEIKDTEEEALVLNKKTLNEQAQIDSLEVVDNICRATFNEEGALTQKRVDAILHDGQAKVCDSIEVTIGEKVTDIAENAFYGRAKISSVYIPEGVKSIGNGAFSGCSRLSSITIPASVSEIGANAFNGCSSLSSLIISKGVSKIGMWAFSGCSSLTKVTIPYTVTEMGCNPFSGCSKLTIYCKTAQKPSTWRDNWNSANIPVVWADDEYTVNDGVCTVRFNEDGELTKEFVNMVLNNESLNGCEGICAVICEGVTSIADGAFYGCKHLSSVTIPESVTKIGKRAFEGCVSLKNVTLENGVLEIDSCAFNNCSSLKRISIPKSVTAIGEHAFQGCTSLEQISLENGLTSIKHDAFFGCVALWNITIPKSVTELESCAFENCDSLTIYIEADSQPSSWHENWNPSGRPTIY